MKFRKFLQFVVAVMIILACSRPVMAVEKFALSVPEMSKWNATHCVLITHADLTCAVSNTAQTITNVLPIAAGESMELVAYVLDTAFAGATHSNAWTNSIALTVTDAGGTNSIMGSTEIHADSTEVWVKLPFVTSSLTHVSAATLSTNSLASLGVSLVSACTTSTTTVVTWPAGNKYYSAANYVNVTFTPTDTPAALSDPTAGQLRLFFRRIKSNE